MAVRQVLTELAIAYRQQVEGTANIEVAIESVGGVVAAKRVQAGEPFDLAVLAADAIDKLADDGCVVAGSRTDLVLSQVAIAVQTGSSQPDISSEAALRSAVLAARSLGYSTGPSGKAVTELFERWGIADKVRERMVQAPSGIPVGQLVASGEVELGFQQQSELVHLPGIELLGTMPEGCEIITTFSAGLCVASTQSEAVNSLLAFLQSPAAAEIKRRQGMETVQPLLVERFHL
jgi:molybdate transport system substrate-binding protein